jgi:hypothetical protein
VGVLVREEGAVEDRNPPANNVLQRFLIAIGVLLVAADAQQSSSCSASAIVCSGVVKCLSACTL